MRCLLKLAVFEAKVFRLSSLYDLLNHSNLSSFQPVLIQTPYFSQTAIRSD